MFRHTYHIVKKILTEIRIFLIRYVWTSYYRHYPVESEIKQLHISRTRTEKKPPVAVFLEKIGEKDEVLWLACIEGTVDDMDCLPCGDDVVNLREIFKTFQVGIALEIDNRTGGAARRPPYPAGG